MRSRSVHRALVRHGNDLLCEDVATEPPDSGGLLIALSYVGVCGTDLQILNGTRPDTARVLGHEGVGVVASTGPAAAWHIGDRVVFNPVAQLSAGRILGHNVSGLFQQYLTVDAQAVDSGLIVPAGQHTAAMSGALIEPLASVIYGHELISRSVTDLRTVAIFGAGPVGILAAMVCNARGIRALLVHPDATRLRTAVELQLVGENSVLLVSNGLAEQILAANGGSRVDAALICTSRQGAPVALQHAVQIVRDGGCIDMITNFPEGTPVPAGIANEAIRAVRAANVSGVPDEGAYIYGEISRRRLAFTGHRGTSVRHLTGAMQELRLRSVEYGRLITHVRSLESAAPAIQALANSRKGLLDGRDCIKTVIDMTPLELCG
jgi:threonine dehydrogenase-like Zn-dependent dehydrogenase